MSVEQLFVSLHDWKTRRKMERSFRSDRDPYRAAPPAERRKHALLTALLSDRRYRRALDAGCAEGVFTRQIAPLCDRVVALDISETAIWRAMVNLADVSNVSFVRANLREHPAGPGWDLIVLNDVMRHLDAGGRCEGEFLRLCERISDTLVPGGRVLLSRGLVSETDYAEARRHAGFLLAAGALRPVRDVVGGGFQGEPRFLVSLFERPAAGATASSAEAGLASGRQSLLRNLR